MFAALNGEPNECVKVFSIQMNTTRFTLFGSRIFRFFLSPIRMFYFICSVHTVAQPSHKMCPKFFYLLFFNLFVLYRDVPNFIGCRGHFHKYLFMRDATLLLTFTIEKEVLFLFIIFIFRFCVCHLAVDDIVVFGLLCLHKVQWMSNEIHHDGCQMKYLLCGGCIYTCVHTPDTRFTAAV